MALVDSPYRWLCPLTALLASWLLTAVPALADDLIESRPLSVIEGAGLEALTASKGTPTERFANGVPQASATVDSVVDEGGGRFTVGGVAVDRNGNPACALVLASGRCMFTCGAGSPRCEGGAANLPFGRFELNGLPTESNGTIVVQTFVQGHVSGTQVLGGGGSGSAQWGVFLSGVCCQNGPATLSITLDGVTRASTASCGRAPTWEGYVTTSAGPKTISTTFSSPCVNGGGTLNFNLVADRCNLFDMIIENDVLRLRQLTGDCTSPPR